MLIKYLGPRDRIKVAPHGLHYKDEVKEYDDDFGSDLLASSTRQRFEEVDGIVATSPLLKDLTVPKLQALCKELEIEYGPRDKKADLIALIETHTAEPPDGAPPAEPLEE